MTVGGEMFRGNRSGGRRGVVVAGLLTGLVVIGAVLAPSASAEIFPGEVAMLTTTAFFENQTRAAQFASSPSAGAALQALAACKAASDQSKSVILESSSVRAARSGSGWYVVLNWACIS